MQINSSPQRLFTGLSQREPAARSRLDASDTATAPVSRVGRALSQNSEVLLARQADSERNNEVLQRNPRNRAALQAYFDNSYTAPEAGVELAGIDTYI